MHKCGHYYIFYGGSHCTKYALYAISWRYIYANFIFPYIQHVSELTLRMFTDGNCQTVKQITPKF